MLLKAEKVKSYQGTPVITQMIERRRQNAAARGYSMLFEEEARRLGLGIDECRLCPHGDPVEKVPAYDRRGNLLNVFHVHMVPVVWRISINNNALGARDGWTCGICQQSIDPRLRRPNRMSMSADHIVPKSRGGLDVEENLQAAHLICNIRKGTRDVEEARRLTSTRLRLGWCQ